MEFLVRAEINIPTSMGHDDRAALIDAENTRASELRRAGHLVRLWRIPGRLANWGLWSATDATELHSILTSLPFWQYMDMRVEPLAQHANDNFPGRDD
jgi:muconolactone D-isomerase